MSANVSVYYICFKKSPRKIYMKLLMVATLGKQYLDVERKEGRENIPFFVFYSFVLLNGITTKSFFYFPYNSK